jgi:cell division protein FtsZ
MSDYQSHGQLHDGFARIKVIGVGGGGSNAIDRMVDTISGVELITVNTDEQALSRSHAPMRLRIGERLTKGLGSGGQPVVGQKAAEETYEELQSLLRGADMVFIAAGMGGGTGTGAAPVIASIAQDMGALTVGVVTKPFRFEGSHRMRTAEQGIEQLRPMVDTLIVIPNERLLAMANRSTTMVQAFHMADSVLQHAIQGIADLVTQPGIVNVDFADIKSVMASAGSALMAIGTGHGDNRMLDAMNAAISSPLLEVSIDGARGVLLNVTGGEDVTLVELYEAATELNGMVSPDANIIWGHTIDPNLAQGQVKVTLIATGFDAIRPEHARSTTGARIQPLSNSGAQPQQRPTAAGTRPGTGAASPQAPRQQPASILPAPPTASSRTTGQRPAVPQPVQPQSPPVRPMQPPPQPRADQGRRPPMPARPPSGGQPPVDPNDAEVMDIPPFLRNRRQQQ